jgi:hypothetical protein
MPNLKWQTMDEQNLSIILGMSPIYWSTTPETKKKIETIRTLSAHVLALYPNEPSRREISDIVSIDPDGPKLLATSVTIEEFNERLISIYERVLAWQASYQSRIAPKDTGNWEWETRRTFGWKDDKDAIQKGFPIELIATQNPAGSTVTGSVSGVYKSDMSIPRNVSFV